MSHEKKLYPRQLFRHEIAVKKLSNFLPAISNFLEIGAGRGDFSIILSDKIKKGTIIDFSDEAVSIIRDRVAMYNIDVIQDDFLTHTFEDKFSLIVMFEVLEHIENDNQFLKRAYDTLVYDGLLYLSVPSRMKYWGYTDEIAGHYRRYEKKELKKILENNNFALIKFVSYGFPLLNVISYFRNLLFRIHRKKNKTETGVLEDRSQKSGVGFSFPFRKFFDVVVRVLFSRVLVRFYVWALKPFENLDLGDGYLVMCKKISK